MTADWKPGDLAMLDWPINADGAFAAVRGQGRWHMLDWLELQSDDSLTDSWLENLGATIRPLVVIDPEDAEQVGRLHKELFFKTGVGWSEFDRTQAALRQFASPAPPKPAEPQGLGAVVEDASGRRWVKVDSDTRGCDSWTESDTGMSDPPWLKYADISAVRVLSDGITTKPGG